MGSKGSNIIIISEVIINWNRLNGSKGTTLVVGLKFDSETGDSRTATDQKIAAIKDPVFLFW